jgi:hypothetical protein
VRAEEYEVSRFCEDDYRRRGASSRIKQGETNFALENPALRCLKAMRQESDAAAVKNTGVRLRAPVETRPTHSWWSSTCA